jgi:hypothetical protein
MTDDRGWGEDNTLQAGGKWIKKPKHYPKPKYCKCNKGHTLVEVYNETYNRYDWDCPVCINMMKKEREKANTLNIEDETVVWT